MPRPRFVFGRFLMRGDKVCRRVTDPCRELGLKSMAGKTTAAKPKRSVKAQRPTKQPCPHCKPGPEYYRMVYDLYKFDVSAARELVRDGREVFELSEEDVAHALKWAHIYPQHLDHVSLEFPGIVAHYWHPEPDGTSTHGTVLIDGHHRAAKAQQLNTAFFVQVLTEQESLAITLRSPNHQTMAEFWKQRRQK